MTANDASGENLIDPDAWAKTLPAEVFVAFSDWAAGQAFQISLVRWLTGGRSGSYVAVVRIAPENDRIHHAILKLLPPEIGKQESLGVDRAGKWTPRGFWDAHMVPTVAREPLPLPGWWLHLQQVAHADLAHMRPLAALIDEPDFAEYCGKVVDGIVQHWHLPADPDPRTQSAQSFLTDFLAKHQKGLRYFASLAGLDLGRPSDWVVVPGRADVLPNPLALLAGTLTDPESGRRLNDPVDVYVSNGHGDLHLFNVLVPATAPISIEQFRLIDYGRFSTDTPVSRDPVKLLLSVAAHWLPGLAPGSALRSNLAELIVASADHPPSPPVVGYLAVAQRVHQAASRWGTLRDMPETWARQHLLVLIGSALRTVADQELAFTDRWWFFEVAALATRVFAETDWRPGAPHVSTPPSLAPPTDSQAARTEKADQPSSPAPKLSMPHESGRVSGAVPSRPGRDGEPTRFSGKVKLAFVRRLGPSWQDLSDLLDIPLYIQATFVTGNEARALWEWLEVRNQLNGLEDALREIGREDLADFFACE
ncbi:hypothetical protein [Actinomadura madurae]|uniref:hypothetical protein n=1 Tax=Actinomadura madurae TaxID=1993 RepID=UPI000D8A055E|nr:hypothetical protein [Actinomadura madurae]SPT51847.1 Uncharacterised protein [Actinomadura madurae]